MLQHKTECNPENKNPNIVRCIQAADRVNMDMRKFIYKMKKIRSNLIGLFNKQSLGEL